MIDLKLWSREVNYSEANLFQEKEDNQASTFAKHNHAMQLRKYQKRSRTDLRT